MKKKSSYFFQGLAACHLSCGVHPGYALSILYLTTPFSIFSCASSSYCYAPVVNRFQCQNKRCSLECNRGSSAVTVHHSNAKVEFGLTNIFDRRNSKHVWNAGILRKTILLATTVYGFAVSVISTQSMFGTREFYRKPSDSQLQYMVLPFLSFLGQNLETSEVNSTTV